MNVLAVRGLVEMIMSWPNPYSADALAIFAALVEACSVPGLRYPLGEVGQYREDSGNGCVYLKFIAIDADTICVFDAGRLPS